MSALPLPPTPVPKLRISRPSLLDPLLKNEPWLGPCCCYPHLLVLYVENRPVSLIPSTPFDRAALESRLFQLRSHFPRKPILPPSRRKSHRKSRSLS